MSDPFKLLWPLDCRFTVPVAELGRFLKQG
jgi:hypothetical protein